MKRFVFACAGAVALAGLIGAADAAGEPLIALLGDPRFYTRFVLYPRRSSG